MIESHPPSLDNNAGDLLAALTRVCAGIVPHPIVAPLIAEIVGTLIPNQRTDRIATFVQLLSKRVSHLEEAQLRRDFADRQNIDLLEDSFFQAARATSTDRLLYIAEVAARGISVDDVDHTEPKRMLWLLGQLNDQEVLVLRSLVPIDDEQFELDAAFRTMHPWLFVEESDPSNLPRSQRKELTLRASYVAHLTDLQLLESDGTYVGPHGTLSILGGSIHWHRRVTLLGEMLLEHIGLLPDWYDPERYADPSAQD